MKAHIQLDRFQMDTKHFSVQKLIYQGRCTRIEKSIDNLNNNKLVIIHTLPLIGFQTSSLFEFIQILFKLHLNTNINPHILPFYGFSSTLTHFQIIYDDPDDVSLVATKDMAENEKMKILHSVAEAIGVCHSCGAAHLRVKPTSIFSSKGGNYYLGCFSPPSIIDLDDEDSLLPFYQQPLFARDSYLFGLLIFQVLQNRTQTEILEQIWRFEPLLKPKNENKIEDENDKKSIYYEIAGKCLLDNPKKRPNFEDILKAIGSSSIIEVREKGDFFKNNITDEEIIELINKIEGVFFYLLRGYIYTIKKDDQKALKIFLSSNLAENANALNNAAVIMHKMSRINPESEANSVSLLLKSADLGFSVSQRNYGVALLNGIGVTKDCDRATFYLKKSAKQGYVESLFGLFFEYVSKDNPNCSKYLRSAARKTLPCAMHMYGLAIERGLGMPGDRSIDYFRVGAENHYPQCMNNFATRVDDISISNHFWKKAAESGLKHAQYNYAVSLLIGRGIAANLQEAANYMKMASDQHYPPAMFDYAIMLRDGIGVPKDENAAEKACIEAAKYKIDSEVMSIEMQKQYNRIRLKREEKLKKKK